MKLRSQVWGWLSVTCRYMHTNKLCTKSQKYNICLEYRHTHTHACMYMRVCVCMYVCMCVYIYMYMYVYVCMYIYIYPYIHTHIIHKPPRMPVFVFVVCIHTSTKYPRVSMQVYVPYGIAAATPSNLERPWCFYECVCLQGRNCKVGHAGIEHTGQSSAPISASQTPQAVS